MTAFGTCLRWAPPLVVLAAGIASRDCIVIAAAGPLGLFAFYGGMDAAAPMDAIRAAIRCALAGAASLLAAGALVVLVLAAIHGTWDPAHDPYYAGVGLLAVSIAAFVAATRDEGEAGRARPSWAIAGASLAAGFALALSTQGLRGSLCALPLAIAALMALAGWRLLREVAPAFLVRAAAIDVEPEMKDR